MSEAIESNNEIYILSDKDEAVRETSIDDKYLTFAISEQTFGLPISDIIEIVNTQKATIIPNTPNYIKGVINLRGKIVPLIDMNLRFGKPETVYTEKTCVIVVEMEEDHIGVIVDYVYEVLDILEISEPPDKSKAGINNFVSGIGKLPDNGMALLLDTIAVVENGAVGEIDSII